VADKKEGNRQWGRGRVEVGRERGLTSRFVRGPTI